MSKKSNAYVQGKDTYNRMNYLCQASELMVNTNPMLSRVYADLITNISKKAVLKLDQEIKRSICKRCHSYLSPGKTSAVKLRGGADSFVKVTCLTCKKTKRFNARLSRTWREDPENVQAVHFEERSNENSEEKLDLKNVEYAERREMGKRE